MKVPAAVQDTFGRMFPGAGHVEWAGKQGYLVTEFREGGTDMQAWFDAAGKWYMTEEDVPYALLSQAVRTAFESGEYAAMACGRCGQADARRIGDSLCARSRAARCGV